MLFRPLAATRSAPHPVTPAAPLPPPFQPARRRLRAGLACLLLCAGPPAVRAQIPDAGRSMRNIENTMPAASPRPSRPMLDDSATPPASPSATGDRGGSLLRLRRFILTGNRLYDEAALQALLADLIGTEQDLDGLRAAADRITRYYQDRGYLLARAYLPPQEIEDGVVTIAVQEGVYDDITLDNRSRVDDAVLRRGLSALKAGDAVHIDRLESRLQALNELPGAAVQGTLRPGAAPGSTTLRVDAAPTPLATGSIEADNFGGYYTGEYRLSGNLDIDSPLRLGDQLGLRLLASDGRQRYYQAAYRVPVGAALTRLGMNVSHMRYALGREFDILEAHGTARTTGFFVEQPLVYGRQFQLRAQLTYEDKRLSDAMDVFSVRDGKRVQIATASLTASGEDGLFGGGRSAALLSYGWGSLRLDSARLRAVDQAYTQSAGGFGKANLTLLRQQNLPGPFTLYAQVNGQLATRNLDGSEEFSLGGPYGVRAFANGEASGDQGWQATAELRYLPMPGLQLAAFADAGRVTVNRRPWNDARNTRRLSAAGLSLTQSGPRHQVMAAMAWPIQKEDEHSGPRAEPRFWLRATRYF
ncbi:ShlB/FhaC/HecB family hemolysin secretion/activation protein [Achromobacter denitrificans]|uniref:ShlB/FhaC/HecB family hemolysin secretion/activation protein n=1 Tax=Achromobacter denitrificans TaxID=32002 RepID=UPI0014680046|nr:ShlB/FhaC/HecB family hemolysin secretion/activation protein [Achromobacter denitrificans]CAB3895389.1 Heme/hemopexin transporter protein HuxB [Achromobacter denitrificans]